jgi:hypothetical protein
VLEDRYFGDTEEVREFLGRDRPTDLLDFVCDTTIQEIRFRAQHDCRARWAGVI